MKFYGACLIFLCFILLGGQATAQLQEMWDLQRCIDYAKAHNIQIKQQELQKRLAVLALRQSKMSQLPTLNGNSSGGYNFGRSVDPTTNQFVNTELKYVSIGVNAGLNLFNWFQLRNNIAANRFAAAASEASLEKLQNDVSLNVAIAYLQILLASEQLKVNEVQVKQTQTQLENTRKLVTAGTVPESNQAELEAQLARDSANLVIAKNNLILYTLQIKALLNLDLDTPFTPVIPAHPELLSVLDLQEMQPEQVYAEALAKQPQIRAAALQVKAAEKSLAAAKRALLPSISMFGTLGTNYASTVQERFGSPVFTNQKIGSVNVNGTNYDVYTQYPVYQFQKTPFGNQIGNNFRQSFGVGMSIPLLNGYQSRSAMERARINVMNQQLIQEQQHLQLKQDIYKAYTDATASLQKYTAAQKTVAASQKAYDFATKRYNLGLMNAIEYLTTQNNLFKAQTDMISARYDYLFKMKILEFYKNNSIKL